MLVKWLSCIGYLYCTHSRSLHPFDIVYIDLWGPSLIVSMNGIKYFLLLVDDCVRFIWIYVLSNKIQATSIFLHFEAYVERKFSTKMKMFQSDWGIELKSLNSHFFKCVVLHNLFLYTITK